MCKYTYEITDCIIYLYNPLWKLNNLDQKKIYTKLFKNIKKVFNKSNKNVYIIYIGTNYNLIDNILSNYKFTRIYEYTINYIIHMRKLLIYKINTNNL